MRKTGFTLAEVLITLGIIGVVAAITIPALHTKITKIVLKNQIKKAMSLVAQNYRATVDEVGSPSDGMNGSFSYGDFNTAFLNNFKMARICNGNGLRDKCVPEYEGLNVSSCSGFNEANVYNKQTIYVTLEGVIIILYHPTWRSLWLVDVNGMKGPNKAGWDLFQVVMDDSTADRPKWGGRSCINQGSPAISGSITSGDFSFSTLANW
jgi:prepilin-type N-terminal cleavage/methylation domain-containing protein